MLGRSRRRLLWIDVDKGEYIGALELSFKGVFSPRSNINTKMPDGSDGHALLILITAEFAPIQLDTVSRRLRGRTPWSEPITDSEATAGRVPVLSAACFSRLTSLATSFAL
jgi:hypothetical protein